MDLEGVMEVLTRKRLRGSLMWIKVREGEGDVRQGRRLIMGMGIALGGVGGEQNIYLYKELHLDAEEYPYLCLWGS